MGGTGTRKGPFCGPKPVLAGWRPGRLFIVPDTAPERPDPLLRQRWHWRSPDPRHSWLAEPYLRRFSSVLKAATPNKPNVHGSGMHSVATLKSLTLPERL